MPSKLVGQEHLIRWLGQAVRFHGLTAARNRNSRAMRFSDEVLDHLDNVWRQKEPEYVSDDIEALRTCLGMLTPYCQKLIKLRYDEGLTGQALAEAVNRKLNTVYVALARTHKTLAECVRGQVNEMNQTEGGLS